MAVPDVEKRQGAHLPGLSHRGLNGIRVGGERALPVLDGPRLRGGYQRVARATDDAQREDDQVKT